MPWMTILVFAVVFYLSYKKNKDVTKSALYATGAAAATYALVEPTNSSAVFGDTSREVLGMSGAEAGTVPSGTTVAPTAGATGSGTSLSSLITPLTAGVAGLAAGSALSGGSDSGISIWWWIGGGVLLYSLLSD